MSNVGFATLSVIPSFQGFHSRLSAGVAAPMMQAGRDGGRKFGDAAGREAGDRFKRGWSERLKGFAPLAGLAAGAGAVAFFKDAIEGASDLSESGNKIQAIFGDAQNEVQKYASTASDSLGQTQLQALDAASTFGTFGKAAGLTGAELANFSTELVGLSTDMASFFNTDVETAIQAIGSGLRGEAEPLRQFGVLLDDATLRQEALRQGLVSTTKDALTPQQKVLAAHSVIMQQTADAQGDFQRTSDGLANQQRILTAQWEEMKTAVGAELLPAMTGLVSFVNQDALPALGEVGGLAKDAAGAFGDLPSPVKAATAAFIALRIAAATGLTATAASGVASVSSAMVSLRLRTMMAADAFTAARSTTMSFNGNVGTVSRGVGRLSASMTGLRAGAMGAGSALKSGLGGAMSLLGGPWGIALLGATAAVAHFWQENQEAKRRIDDMTASLDEQTGALTKNSRETAFKALQDSGAIDAAKTLGLNLEDVTSAALGNEAALVRVRDRLSEFSSTQTATSADSVVAVKNWIGVVSDQEAAANTVRDALGRQNDELAQSRQDWQDHAEAMGQGADAAEDAAGSNDEAANSFVSLRDRMREARDEVERLADAEQKRRLANLKNRRDRLALVEQMQATAVEATNSEEVNSLRDQIAEERKRGAEERRDLQRRMADIDPKSKTAGRDRADLGRQIAESRREESEAVADLQSKLGEYTRTLDINTKAGQENLSSLYDLADQWNNSSGKVRNAKGMYDQIRESFIKSAEDMGASKKRAKELADQLLLLPKERKTEIKTPGLEKALEDLRKLEERLKSARELAIYVNTHQEGNTRQLGKAYATGGYVSGFGTKTSDSIPAWLSNGEFVQRAAAVDYYGVEFMRRLNALQVPKQHGYANGGLVQAPPASKAGLTVGSQHFYGVDYRQWKRDQEHDMRAAAIGAVDFSG